MKRRLLIAAIFLLAGAVVNVAVAWGCSVFSPRWSEVGHDYTYGGVLVVPLENLPAPSGQDPSDLGGSAFEVVQWTLFRAGLPVRSLTGHITERTLLAATTSPTGRQPATYSGLWSLPRRIGPGLPHVPLIPVWPGFAVNSLFYAAILWLLIPGPSKAQAGTGTRKSRDLRIEQQITAANQQDLSGTLDPSSFN